VFADGLSGRLGWKPNIAEDATAFIGFRSNLRLQNHPVAWALPAKSV